MKPALGKLAEFCYRSVSAVINLPLVILGRLRPEWGLRAARLAGRGIYALRRCPAAGDLADLLGDRYDAQRYRAMAKAIAVNSRMNAVQDLLVRTWGISWLADTVQHRGEDIVHDLLEQKIPTVVVCMHQGPPWAVIAALCRLGLPHAVIIASPITFPHPRELQHFVLDLDPLNNARKLRDLGQAVKQGTVGVIFADGRSGRTETVAQFLGRQYPFRAGLAAIQQLTGATLIPASCAWKQNSTTVTFHPPFRLSPSAAGARLDEATIIAVIADWWTGYLRDHPEQIRIERLREYLRSPAADAEKGRSTDHSSGIPASGDDVR